MFAMQSSDSPTGRLMLQPDAENIAGGVHIAIVRRSAVRAFPSSYSKRAHTFRTAGGNGPAARARLGTVSLVSFDIHRLPSGSFVTQHLSECRPARVEHGFSHPRLGEAGSIHIANDDQTVLSSDPGGLLVEVVTARVRDLRMDRTDAPLVASPLRNRELGFVLPVVPQGENLSAVAQRGEVLQAKVDADDPVPNREVISDLALECDVPTPASILDKTAALKFALQIAGFPKSDMPLQINCGVTFDFRRSLCHRNPAQRPSSPMRVSKPRATAMLITRTRKLSADFIHGNRMDTEIGGEASCQFVKINCGWPSDSWVSCASALGFALSGYAEIPDSIARGRMTAKEPVPALHSIFEGDDAHSSLFVPRIIAEPKDQLDA